MENLLNAEVIKAAASSPLGTLSLMCLILGVVALGFFKESPVRAKLVVFGFLVAGVVGFGYAILNQQQPGARSDPAAPPEATRDYVVGRWQVEQNVGGIEGGSFIDYHDDGRFTGRQETFVNGQGARVPVSGNWAFVKLDRERFRLELAFDSGESWHGVFRILGPDRIHNAEQNYLAIRVPN